MKKTSNELIAEFMGIEPFSPSGQYEAKDVILATDMSMNPCIQFNSPLDVLYEDDFRFDKSWDWLMPVISRIENIKNNEGRYWFEVVIYSDAVIIDDVVSSKTLLLLNKSNGEFETKLEATFKAVVEFIKWYNENK